MRAIIVLAVLTLVAAGCSKSPESSSVFGAIGSRPNADVRIRLGHPQWPMAWTTYCRVGSLEEDIVDIKVHGVGLISADTEGISIEPAEAQKIRSRFEKELKSRRWLKSAGLGGRAAK